MEYTKKQIAMIKKYFNQIRDQGRIDAAKNLKIINKYPIHRKNNELRLFMTVRNESKRLPFFIKYYKERGVDRFFMIDNNSTDKTRELLRNYKNVHLLYTKDSYDNQSYWIDYLLHKYGVNHWCLVVDADEFLVYPQWESINIKDLCAFLNEKKLNCLKCILIDMYPDNLKTAKYKTGMNPLEHTFFFDYNTHFISHHNKENPIISKRSLVIYTDGICFSGGMRYRLFGLDVPLIKHPLVKFNKDMYLSRGAHFLEGANSGGLFSSLLHYKYFSDFYTQVKKEARREQHWNKARAYKRYYEVMKGKKLFSFMCDNSIMYKSPRQLIKLQMINFDVK